MILYLCITQDNKVINKESTYITSNKIGEAGAILNIVFASILSILLIWTIIFPILGFCTIVSNLRYKNGKDNKIMAGVLGILFAGLIGGIMVLLGNSNK